MKKLISAVTSASLILSACAPDSKKSAPEIVKPQEEKKLILPNKAQTDLNTIVRLLDMEYPHLGVAEYFAQAFKSEHPEAWSQIQAQSLYYLSLQNRIDQEQKSEFSNFLFSGGMARSNSGFVQNMIAGANVDKTAFHNRLQIQTVSLAQGAALRRIFDIFNEQLDKNTNELAREMVEDLKTHNPEALSSIDKAVSEDVRLRAQAIQKILVKYDRVLAKYDFAAQDDIKLLIYGLVANRLIVVLKDNPTVRVLLQTVEKIHDTGKKVREIQLTIATMDKYRKDMRKDWEDISTSFKAMKLDMDFYRGEILAKRSKKAVADMIYDVFDGSFEEPLKGDKKSIVNQEHPLDENTQKFVSSVAQTAQSFDNVVNTIGKLANVLGVDVPDDVQKVIEAAQKISAGVQLGAAVVNAFSSGGILGVATAFSGGPATMLLAGGLAGGLGGGQAAELAAIKKDLQEIKKMQKETLELQRTSLKMLRELAVMIDENHRESLLKMESIYREVKSLKELEGIVAERDFRSCQEIVLSTINTRASESSKVSVGIKDVPYLRNEALRGVSSLERLERAILMSSATDWSQCQSFLSSTFSRVVRSNLFYARLAYRSDNQSGVDLEADLYLPALDFLSKNSRGGRWLQDLNLHLPMNTMDSVLHYKSPYLEMGISKENDLHEIRALLAPEALERYIATLLAVHSLVALDVGQWSRLPEVLPDVRDRSMRWLKPALGSVQMAIAQEAILAGEPLLKSLAINWRDISREQGSCKDIQKSPYCFVRQNTLMMKNIMTFLISRYLRNDLAVREVEYRKEVAIALGVLPERIQERDGKLYFMLTEKNFEGLIAEVPSEAEARKGLVSYSENMLKLIEMQNMLSSELSRLSVKGTGRAEELAKLFVFRAL